MNTKKVLAKHVMQTNVVKVLWSMTVSEMEKLFQAHQITGAPVVDDFGKLVGVVSETDVLNLDISEASSRADKNIHPYFRSFADEESAEREDEFRDELDKFNEKRVEDIMTPWTCTAYEWSPITKIAEMMVNYHLHRVLIVDDNKELKGIVTTIDIARAVAQSGGKGKVPLKKAKAVS